MDDNKNVFDMIIDKWKDRIPFILGIAGLITIAGYFIAYWMLTDYLYEIDFSVATIETHIVFAVVINIIQFIGSIFILTMAGSFFTHHLLKKHENKEIIISLAWTSSLVLSIFLFSYFEGVELFKLEDKETFFLFFGLLGGLGLIEILIVKKISQEKDILLVVWQLLYTLLSFSTLLFLVVYEDLNSVGLILAILSTVLIHSYPYIFFIFSLEKRLNYGLTSGILVLFIILIIAPNTLQDVAFKQAQIGRQVYENIKITDEACNHLNHYFKHSPCKEDKLKDLQGLWTQGDIYLFADKNGRYKIKKDDIIRKEKKPNKFVKTLLSD